MSKRKKSRKQILKENIIYLLSHHPPEQYSHCLMVGWGKHKVPLCARCTGIYSGFIVSYIIFTVIGIFVQPDLFWLTLGFGLGLMTIVEWVSQRITPRVTNNKLRSGTGFMSGVGLTIVSLMKNIWALYATLIIIMTAFLIVVLYERRKYREEVTIVRF